MATTRLALATDSLLPVGILCGPTGSGKSALALRLAERLPIEIISVDSAQVFRGMDIGTAKPDAATRAAVAHHLLDIRDPSESYSAGDFVVDALAAIHAIHARGRLPLLVGGTLLYLRALLRGLAQLPPASAEIRARLDARAAALGWPALHAELARADPLAAARIGSRDSQRIQRALEVHEITGRPISALQADTRGARARFDWRMVALVPADRDRLRADLVRRLAQMLQSGFADEVLALYRRGDLRAGIPSIRTVGYRQLWRWCAGECCLEEATRLAGTATVQLAKRQLTWLRSEPDYRNIDPYSETCGPELESLFVPAVAALRSLAGSC